MRFGPFIAIVEDTWRQSKQQIVFILMMIIMALLALFIVFMPYTANGENGERVLRLNGAGEMEGDKIWTELYKGALKSELHFEEQTRGARDDMEKVTQEAQEARQAVVRARLEKAPEDEQKKLEETFKTKKAAYDKSSEALQKKLGEYDEKVQKAIDARSPGLSKVEKGLEAWLYLMVYVIFLFSIVLFVPASAGYFPDMLAAGAVDVLVSKPIRRVEIFFGKFVGGLALFSALLVATYLVVFLGLGLRTGVFPLRVFAAIPLTVFSVALLWAIVAWVGVFSRSTALALITGYAYYFIIEWVIWALQNLGTVLRGLKVEAPWLTTVSDVSRWIFPGFGRLDDAISAAVVNVPIFEPGPIAVGCVWLLLALGTSYLRFRTADF